MITFLNQPYIVPYGDLNDYNEQRVGLLPHVETFLSNHPLFKDKDITISFPDAGHASLVCILETANEKRVLKIPLSDKKFYSAEAIFLRAWEKVGVKVPHVFEEGEIAGKHYSLMNFIDAKTVRDTYKKGAVIREEVFVKMGSILRTMHSAKGEGFGALKNGKGQYARFDEWLDYEITKKSPHMDGTAYIDNNKHGDFPTAIKIMNEYMGDSNVSSYCHNDFAYQNLFATEPFTVFDPVPLLGPPYMDLGRAMIQAIARGISDEAAEQLMRGYSGNDLILDRRALQAAILIQSSIKFSYWSKTDKVKGIKDVQAYLEKTKQYLE